MTKIIKVISSIIGLIILLAIAAILVLVTTVDPNDYKKQISEKVATQTGRTLELNGKLSWSFFPWLGIEINDATLSNTKNFSTPKPFAHIEKANVHVQLLPLLKKEIKVGVLELNGLQLNLVKDKQGNNNWSDVAAPSAGAAVSNTDQPISTTTSDNKKFTFAIEGIDINDAEITWLNLQNNQTAKIKNLQLHAKDIEPNNAFPLSFKGDIQSNQPQLDASMAIDTKIDCKIKAGIYQLNDLVITTELNDKSYKNGQLTIKLSSEQAITDLNAQTLQIKSLVADIANMQIRGDLTGTQIKDDLKITGPIQIPSFNLGEFLATLGKPNDKLQTANANFQLTATDSSARLDNLRAQLNDSKINGNFAIADFGKKLMNFNLAIDRLDLDKFSDTPATTKNDGFIIKTANAAPAESNEGIFPVDTLRSLNAIGQLQIGNLHSGKYNINNFKTTLNAHSGVVNLNPLSAQLYQGNFNGSTTINVLKTIPQLSFNAKLTNIQAEPLFRDLSDVTRIQLSGLGSLVAQINTQGNDKTTLLNNLSGQGNLALQNGVLHGVDIPYWFNFAKSLIKRETPVTTTDTKQTAFGKLTGSYVISRGVLTTKDLLLVSPNIQMNGSGTANLVSENLDFLLNIQPLHPETHQAQGYAVPLRVKGSFDKPSFAPDAQAIIKGELQNQLEKNQDKIKEQLNNAIDKNVGGNLGEQLKKMNLDSLLKQ